MWCCQHAERKIGARKIPGEGRLQKMADEKQTELASAPTKQLPALGTPAEEDSPKFAAEQKRVEEMIDAGAPLHDVLCELVLMIEAQSPEMLCSILLLSDDGNHVRHAVAPSLPESYIKIIDGSQIGRASCRERV